MLFLIASLLTATAAPIKSILLSPPLHPPRLRALQRGVDRGPNCAGPATIAPQLSSSATTLIRTHDAGVLDWCVLFPDPTADPSLPQSYSWAAGDAYFKTILEGGFRPYIRLGVSWTYPSPSCINPDPALFAAVAVKTLAHYNDGWAGGFLPPPAQKVQHCELWNEPDGQPRFWNSSSDAFHALFDAAARAIKAYDPLLLVGGPGVAQPLGPLSYNYSFGLLDFVAARSTPIDFFSWHTYGHVSGAPGSWGHSPADLYNGTIAAVRAGLAARGLQHLKQHITEWDPAILGNETVTGGAEAASFTASALTFMADADDVAVSVFYPGCEGVGADGSWGLFEDFGNGTVGWRREGRAWGAVGATLRDAPLAMGAVFPAEKDYTVLAGGSASGALVSVVVSARASSFSGFSLSVPVSGGGVGGGGVAAVSVFLMDGVREGAWQNTTAPINGGVCNVLVAEFSPPSVAWVRVET